MKFWSIDPEWAGATVVCIGSGPSLTLADVQTVAWHRHQPRSTVRVIAINDAYRLAPWADLFYACDWRWWMLHGAAVKARPEVGGRRVMMQDPDRADDAHPERFDLDVLRCSGAYGLETLFPSAIRHGFNSGAQVINVAWHLGAARVVLLGYDCRADAGLHHWWGNADQAPPPYHKFRFGFEAIAERLRAIAADPRRTERPMQVVNASRTTALEMFPKLPLHEAIVGGLELSAAQAIDALGRAMTAQREA